MKHLVLLGTGPAHVELLYSLAAKPPSGVRVSLISPHLHHFCCALMPGFVAGRHDLQDCVIALEPLLKRAEVGWLGKKTAALDAQMRRLRLEDGSTFGFDWLSIDIGPVQDRHAIEALVPGAREHGLFVYPPDTFCALWPRVTELGAKRGLRIAVLGAGATGIELALAMRQRLPGSSVTLVSPAAVVATNYPAAARARVVKVLKQRGITQLSDLAVGIEADQVLLGSGARLACDVPVLAIGAQAPAWLGGSGLTLDRHGFVAVDAMQRSVSHSDVFAAAAVCQRANPALAENLLALLAGSKPCHGKPATNTLNFLDYGDRRALVSWADFAAQGRWAGSLKDGLERHAIRRYRRI